MQVFRLLENSTMCNFIFTSDKALYAQMIHT